MQNKIILLLLLTLILSLTGFTAETPQADITAEPISYNIPLPLKSDRTLLGTYTIYAYCPCSKCCGQNTGITASGTQATEGRTIATDTSIPFKTVLYIDGIGERVVEDRGSGIKGNKIDLFVGSHNEAVKFGVKKLKVYEVE